MGRIIKMVLPIEKKDESENSIVLQHLRGLDYRRSKKAIDKFLKSVSENKHVGDNKKYR